MVHQVETFLALRRDANSKMRFLISKAITLRNVTGVVLLILIGLATATVWSWRSFKNLPGSGGRLATLRDIPIDAAWLSLILALLFLFLFSPGKLSSNRRFISFALPIALFVFMYSFEYVPYHTLLFNDSPSYLRRVVTGIYATDRNSGYASILAVVDATIGIDRLPLFQLSVVLVCYLTGAWLLDSCHPSKSWLGPLAVGLFLVQGVTSNSSDQILTEALFTAGLGLFAASLGALVWQPRAAAVIGAMFGIVLATLAKTIGIVLIIPALLAAKFLPHGIRVRYPAPIVAAGLVTIIAMASHNYIRSGVFAPESYAGFTLLGNVAWMLDDTYMPKSELTQQMVLAAEDVVRKRPDKLRTIDSRASVDRYVDYTADEYDELLWTTLYPIGQSHFDNWREQDEFYLRFAISSIRAHPVSYFIHDAAHFYGLWRDLGDSQSLREATIDIRRQPLLQPTSGWEPRNTTPTSILSSYPQRQQLEMELDTQRALPLVFSSLLDNAWINPTLTVSLGLLSLALSALFLLPIELANLYRTEIMIALCLNAYFATHALIMRSLPRYADAGILAALFLIAGFVTTSVFSLKTLMLRRQKPTLT